ncbi:MAG TPA: energy transducer TonB [Bradyrhizobium sp.]|nr:energy transducer TonB [Bradyrhizobium sp.]
MRVWLYLGIAVCLAGIGAVLHGAMPSSRDARIVQSANPEDGKVIGGVFVSDYFNLSYRLSDELTEGLAGPPPSQSGYYVLGTWTPKRDFAGTVLVVAQDMFFASAPSDDVKNVVAEFRQVMSAVDGMTIDREPAPVSVGGHPGYRVDFSGVGLSRSMFAIEIRCHVVTFNLTSRDPELLAGLVSSLDDLDSVRKKTPDPVPECVRDYASENVVHRVEPDGVGAKAVSIPVRMIVATDGSVKHVHVIRASAAQRRNIEEALRQWKFKSYVKQGRPVEVETGMMFNLKPTNM